MCCGYRKLADYFYLTVFFYIDALVLFFHNGVALGLWMLLLGLWMLSLGLWMLSFRSLLTFCDGTYWLLVTDVYNESVWYSTNCGRYGWDVLIRFSVGELLI
jgi:hypothetical protein